MPWFAWLMVATLALGSCLNIAAIGKPRTPLTPNTVITVVVVNALFAWGVVALAGGA